MNTRSNPASLAVIVTFFFHLLTAAILLFAIQFALAQEPASPTPGGSSRPPPSAKLTLEDLAARLDRLEEAQAKTEATVEPQEEALTKLKLDLQLPEPLDGTFTGLGPAASKVYFSNSPLSIGGFGEVHYTSEDSGPRTTNVARVNTFLGYQFSKTILFNSGYAFQNGGAVAGAGAARVEFAYIDLLWDEESGIRLGNILVPVGLRNLRFEPTLFPTVQLPRAELTLLPSTWHENGLLVFYKQGDLSAQVGVVNSGNAARYEANTWIRAGRQGGSNANASDPAWVARLENIGSDGTLGASVYFGHSSQGNSALGRAHVILGAVHGEYQNGPFALQALYTEGTLSDTESLAALTNEIVGSRVRGGYLILSYDTLPLIAPLARALVQRKTAPGYKELPVFFSYEHTNLHADVPAGASRNAALETNTYTVGLNYKPHPQVTLKADFAVDTDRAGGDARVFETAIGFVF